MKKFGDDWHTAEDIVEEIFVNIVREPCTPRKSPSDGAVLWYNNEQP
jgi:hypothetical protein